MGKIQRELITAINSFAPLDEVQKLLERFHGTARSQEEDDDADNDERKNNRDLGSLKPLHYAAYCNNLLAAKLILEIGDDVNFRDSTGYSSMHIACQFGFIEFIKLLLFHNSKVNFIERDTSLPPKPGEIVSEDPLYIAILYNQYTAAEILLKSGANPNQRYFLGFQINVICCALQYNFLSLLLTYGASTEGVNRKGQTILFNAVKDHSAIPSLKLLIERGANVNAVSNATDNFRTPLHYAVISSNVEAVKILLEKGANPQVSIKTINQSSPPSLLHYAVLSDNCPIVKLLLKHGSNPDVTMPFIGSPLHLTCSQQDIINRFAIARALLKSGANVNLASTDDKGRECRTPIVDYVTYCEVKSIRFLQELAKYGATVSFTLPYYNPPGLLKSLHHLNEEPDVFKFLLKICEEFEFQACSKGRRLLNSELRSLLVHASSNPFTLKHACRVKLRKKLESCILNKVTDFDIPETLKKFISCEIP